MSEVKLTRRRQSTGTRRPRDRDGEEKDLREAGVVARLQYRSSDRVALDVTECREARTNNESVTQADLNHKELTLEQTLSDSELSGVIEEMLDREEKLPGQRMRPRELEQRLLTVALPVLNGAGLPLVQYESARNYVRELSRVLRRHVGIPLVMDIKALVEKYKAAGIGAGVLGSLLCVSYRALQT
jgi:hypothetical protein